MAQKGPLSSKFKIVAQDDQTRVEFRIKGGLEVDSKTAQTLSQNFLDQVHYQNRFDDMPQPIGAEAGTVRNGRMIDGVQLIVTPDSDKYGNRNYTGEAVVFKGGEVVERERVTATLAPAPAP